MPGCVDDSGGGRPMLVDFVGSQHHRVVHLVESHGFLELFEALLHGDDLAFVVIVQMRMDVYDHGCSFTIPPSTMRAGFAAVVEFESLYIICSLIKSQALRFGIFGVLPKIWPCREFGVWLSCCIPRADAGGMTKDAASLKPNRT
jgi:hypothetical protein